MSELLIGGLLALACVIWAKWQSDRETMAWKEGRRAERLADAELRQLDPEFARELGLFEPELMERQQRERVVEWAQLWERTGVILGAPLPKHPALPPATQMCLPPRPNVPSGNLGTR